MNQSAGFLDVLKSRVYALGRRSSLARATIARLRRLRSAVLGQRPDFIVGELAALLAFLRDSGCVFRSCTALGSNPEPLAMAFRYDVHVRDISAGHAFLQAHRSQQVPASLFLFWDYSGLEHSYSEQFGALAAARIPPIEIGLHDSPVDAHLIQSRFGYDRGAYWAWLNSPDAMTWLATMAADNSQFEAFNDAVLQSFVFRVRATKERFGVISAVAAHGGDLRQALLPKLQALGPEAAQVGRSLFAEPWLTPERLAAAGLATCVDNYGGAASNWRQTSDRGGDIAGMVQRIQNLLRRKKAVQLLLHPFTWDGTKRNGELSQLLRASRAPFKE